MSDPELKLTLEQYAALLVRLPDEPDERARVLANHGLDEASWEELDQQYQAQLDVALDGESAQTGVPDIVSRFSAALDAGAQADAAPPLPLERYAAATRRLRQQHDPQKLLQADGLTMRAYMDAHLYWATRLARDPVLAERFRLLLDGGSDP